MRTEVKKLIPLCIMSFLDILFSTFKIVTGTTFLWYIISYIRNSNTQTPLPDFSALIKIKQNKKYVTEQPKSRIPTKDELTAYCNKYKQYYTSDCSSPLSKEDIAKSLEVERAKYIAFINKEIDEINETIKNTCVNIGQTRQDVESQIRSLYSSHQPSWLAIYEKYTVKTVKNTDQINTILFAFEEYYYEKAHAAIALEDESVVADEFSLDDIYTDDTTALKSQPPNEMDRIDKYIKSNVEFSYIKVYLANLHIDILREKITAIERGDNDDLYMEQATERALSSKYSKLRKNIVIEYTPVGNVCMYYNSDNSSFEYYADTSVPYIILETVARKYCHIYGCRELYICVENETVKMYAEDTIAERKQHMYKHNNVTNALITSDKRTTTADKQAALRAWGQSSSLKPAEPELKEFKRRINNFVKKSPIADFKALQPVPAVQRFKKLSWADYAKTRHATPRKIHPGMEMHESMAALENASTSTFGGGML